MNTVLSEFAHEFAPPLSNSVLIFTILLSIILFVPVMMRKIRVPSLIGLILAGILIGEHGFNLIANDGIIKMFSTIGLLYIMFMAGLELDFNEFKINRNKSLVFGAYTFLLPLTIGYPICHYVLGYDELASFLTASMFSTHTLISYPIVSRMGVSKNQAVAITVGGTILTDATVLILLAVITSSSEGSLDSFFWIKLGISLIIFSAIVFWALPHFARWFLKRADDDKYSHYILVLFILFLSGFLAHLGGLEPIIGAFAAGLALNRLIPHTSALMNRVEFFGNALFIPIFLISVGMIVNLNVIFDGWRTFVVAGTLSIVALMGKYVAALATQKTFGYSFSQGNLIFGLSSSHAAATLAIIIIGFNAGILDIYILNGTIILILITCVVSSLVTQASARKIAQTEDEGDISISEMGHFADEKILVPIANPSNIGHHVELALLMKDKKSVNPVSLLGVFPNNQEVEKNIVNFHKKLQEFVNTATAAEVKVDVNTTIDHNAASGIVRTARETMSDIVILGWPGKSGMLEKLLGDKVDLIIKNMDKNLFICHIEKNLILHQRIVIFSPPYAEKEAGFALWVSKVVQLAQELSVPILHIGDPGTQRIIKEQKKIAPLFTFVEFNNWNKPFSYKEQLNENDMIILISAHEGYISYLSVLDHLPTRLEGRYPNYSRIVIYPKQHVADTLLAVNDHSFIP